MKILQTMAGGAHGGAETFFEDLTLAFGRAGLHQHIVTRPMAARLGLLRAAGMGVSTLRFGGLTNFYTRWRLGKIAENFQPDVVLGWMNRACRALPPGPFVRVGRLGGYYNLKNYKTCDALICNTQSIRDYVIGKGWPADQAFYVPNFCPVGVEPALPRNSFETPEGSKILLILARLEAVKGIDVAITALKKIPGAVLWIAGVGRLQPDLESLARAEGVESRVKFLGWRHDRAALLRAADVCLVPSRYEPFGNVVVNAWAHGIPVVASASDGPRALIEHDVDGMVVPIDDADNLARAVTQLLGDSAMAARLIAGGQHKAAAEYSEKVVVDRYLEVFGAVLARAGR